MDMRSIPDLEQVDWSQHGRGLVPRNFAMYPQGFYASASAFPESELIPESEWPDRLNELRKYKAGLLDLREAYYDLLKSLNQGHYGLCWAFSSTKAAMYVRALMGLPGVRLSAWYVAGMIKRWRDEGGWGAASLEFITQNGVPPESVCPAYESSYDTPEVAAAAKPNIVTEWWDGSQDRATAKKQLVSSLLRGRPCVVDLNWMGHSMCCIDIKSLSPFSVVFDNSWGEQGDHGLYTATGEQAVPDGLVMPRVARASLT